MMIAVSLFNLLSNKPKQLPAMRWVFEIFMGVIQASVTSGGTIIKVSVNLTETQITIPKLMGRGCEKILWDELKVRNVDCKRCPLN